MDGHVREITVTVPWSTILKDDSIVEINGLSLTVQPKVRAEPGILHYIKMQHKCNYYIFIIVFYILII